MSGSCVSKRGSLALVLPTLFTSQEPVSGRGFIENVFFCSVDECHLRLASFCYSLGAVKSESSRDHFAITGCLKIIFSE